MKHQLPKLPFSRDALEPHISGHTIDIHYGKHHQKYIDDLNRLVEGSSYSKLGLEEIIKAAPPGPIFNNAAQAWNHAFYWQSLTSVSSGPQGALRLAIEKQFGTVEKLQAEICLAAGHHFGSGWCWLVSDHDGALSVELTENAKNPLTTGKTPLLTIDVWEHAYYIDYRNERKKYLENLQTIMNWEFAEHNFSEK